MVAGAKSSMCIICDETQQEGIIILGSFICSHCERKIVETSVEQEDYCSYFPKIKKIWAFALSN